MSLSITSTRITSTVVDDQAVRCHDGAWLLSGPVLGPVHIVGWPKALMALAIADAIKSIHPEGPCGGCRTWLGRVRILLAPQHPVSALITGPAALAQHTEPNPGPANPASSAGAVWCLYCGSTDDIYETRVTIDERTDEYALTCGHCHGVWAA